DYATAYNGRGNARFALGDNNGAIADYDQAIKLKPDNAEAYYNRGIARSALGDKKGAVNDYQQAADLYKQQGKTTDYEDALNKIKKLQQ
ncbi:MAG: repeat-containing protein YrrB, partial [Cyanobacteriota bacterium]